MVIDLPSAEDTGNKKAKHLIPGITQNVYIAGHFEHWKPLKSIDNTLGP